MLFAWAGRCDGKCEVVGEIVDSGKGDVVLLGGLRERGKELAVKYGEGAFVVLGGGEVDLMVGGEVGNVRNLGLRKGECGGEREGEEERREGAHCRWLYL